MKDHKLCTNCLTSKKSNQFYKNRKEKDGKAVWCKMCYRKADNEYRPNKIYKRFAEKRAEELKIKQSHTKGWGDDTPCFIPGWTDSQKDLQSPGMEFDHD